jgi:hypothetical protein
MEVHAPTGRDCCQRAMAACHDTRAWSEQEATAARKGMIIL